MLFKEYFIESADITKEVIKLLKTEKDGVMCINSKGILVNFTDYEDGVFQGMDQHDYDVEEETLKHYRLDK
jgi:hypothetical protein